MCTSHLKWRDDPAYLLEENDKPSAVGREAALVLCSEKKQLMNPKILPSLGAVPFFFAKSVTRVKTKKKKTKRAKKIYRRAAWQSGIFFFTCTDWHKQDLFLSALAKLPRDPADQSNGLYWNDPLNSYEET